ncbi:cytochrome P450 4C1-like [Centruroides sculpturatus]|uniref:cytochrome P450 4C1-like n=1 Tax=Centruroides sculpturatus TaxID=218467 RepID=UPI000C6D66AA|nr:cytochrome P450 4C1-like [Centruroides sculpturatus]
MSKDSASIIFLTVHYFSHIVQLNILPEESKQLFLFSQLSIMTSSLTTILTSIYQTDVIYYLFGSCLICFFFSNLKTYLQKCDWSKLPKYNQSNIFLLCKFILLSLYGHFDATMLTPVFEKNNEIGFIHFNIFFMKTIMIFDADHVKLILNNPKIVDRSPIVYGLEGVVNKSITFSNGNEWAKKRKLFTPIFRMKQLDDFIPEIERHSRNTLEKLKSCKSDVSFSVNETIMSIAFETIFGFQKSLHIEEFPVIDKICEFVNQMSWKRTVNVFLRSNLIFDYFSNGKKLKEYCNVLKEISEKAYTTLSKTICWCLYEVGKNPEILAKIQDELDSIFEDVNSPIRKEDLQKMEYLECVINETMRMYPAVPITARLSKEEICVGNQIFPSNCNFLISIYHLQRNSRYFPNPNKFDPLRFLPSNSANRHPYCFIPFSAGRRNCIGKFYKHLSFEIFLLSIR